MGTIKRKVDYFPHDCKPGRTLKILKSMYGNDGFAFWYQLLQILGDTEGHAYDASSRINWLHLASECGVDEPKAREIIKTIVDIEAIDVDIWRSNAYIWCQHFVDRLEDLYKRRQAQIPTKPKLKPLDVCIEWVDVDIETVDVDIVRQSKVKERKVNTIGSKEPIGEDPAPEDPMADLLSKDGKSQSKNQNKARRPKSLAVVRYHELTGAWPNAIQMSAIDDNVVTDVDIDTWEIVVKAWLMRGFSKVGVEGMLEWFRIGIPPRKVNNGQRPETPVAGKDDLKDWKEIENKQRERMKRSGGGGEIKP